MVNLERYVLSATEAALRKSMAVVEKSFQVGACVSGFGAAAAI